MLVLVPRMYARRDRRFSLSVNLAIVVSVLFLPSVCNARPSLPDGDAASIPNSPTQPSVSILVADAPAQPGPTNSHPLNSGANGTATIDDQSSGNATYTAQVLTPVPQHPQDLLIPANPAKSDFDQPFTNDLRGENIVPSENEQPSKSLAPSEDIENRVESQLESKSNTDESIGTFANAEPNQQVQQSEVGSQFNMPTQPPNGFRAPSATPSQFGRQFSGGVVQSDTTNSTSSQEPRLTGSRPSIPPSGSDRPSQWRDSRTNDAGLANNGQRPVNSNQQLAPNIRTFNDSNIRTNRGIIPKQANNAVPSLNQSQAFGQQRVRDDNIRPTGFSQPVSPPRRSTSLAKTLIARYSLNNVSETLPGKPTKLIEMIRQPISPQMRRPMVHQYWETYYDWANFVAAQKYQQWLMQIPAPVSQSEKSTLEAAIAVAANKTLAAEIQLAKSQSGLLQYMPNWGTQDLLPLPDDLPLIQKYKTNYDLYRSRQMMPVSLRGIDQILPKTLDLIIGRADAVGATKIAADQSVGALRGGQSKLASTLDAGRAWRLAEKDLIASVVSYNQAIGDYSLSVATGYQSPEQVVAMLIAKPQSKTASVIDRGKSGKSIVQSPFGSQAQPQFSRPTRSNDNAMVGQAAGQDQAAVSQPWGLKNSGGNSLGQNNVSNAGNTPKVDLGSNGAFRSGQGQIGLGNGQDSATGKSVITPAATPINNGTLGSPPVADPNNGFSPTLPSNQKGADTAIDRSARSQFGFGVQR